ncbi:MAG TPA: outer membrane beta-barrel protein, partial [Puia sp.]|nr:outer membrane beta-barrel protein [Puia sp.]
QPGKNKSLRIKRNLQFGLSLAPDFSSVNSLAGDKPGSSVGITVDYQFANRWYLSTGLLLDRKNYAARQQDYHVSSDWYRMNNLHNVDFVKGSFNMLEVPLNLRYDFSVAGSTLFFASAGFSSYLLTKENCNYYYNWYGREDAKSFSYPNKNNYLFSSINLSLGVETGISNSMSLLIAPYIKIPSRNIGFGQVQMNSVGINFALKFAPVISRKRK